MSGMGRSQSHIDFTDARDIATIIFKRKYTILIAFLIIFMGITIYALSLPRPYEAKSILLVKFGREFLQRPEEPRAGGAPSIPPQAVISGEISMMTSRDVLTKVAEAIGPEKLYPELGDIPAEGSRRINAAVPKLEKHITVTNLPGSSLIELTFSHDDAVIAAKTVNLLVDFFKEKHLEVFSGAGTPFLENQLKTAQKKLDSAEREFAEFRQKYGVFSFEEQRSNLIGQRNAADAALRAAQNQINELRQRAAWIRGPGWNPGSVLELRAPLVTLEQKERELSDKFADSSRSVQSIRKEIEIVKDSIQKNIEMLRQAELQKIEGELSVVGARIAGLSKQSRQLDAEIQSIDAHGRRVQELKRELAEHEQSHQAYTRKLEESLIMDDMDRRKMAAISVVETASVASTRKKQRFSVEQMVAFGFLGGVAGGVALAMLIEMMASSMTLPRSAERRLGIPVMVTIANKKLAQGW